jgi:hypothetical protein
MMTNLTVTAAVVATIAISGTVARAQAPPVTVFLVEPKAEFVDAAFQQRKGLTGVLRYQLQHMPIVRVVDTPEQAVVVLEVVRLFDETQDGTRSVGRTLDGDVQTQAKVAKVLAVKLSVGTYTTELLGRDVPSTTTLVKDPILRGQFSDLGQKFARLDAQRAELEATQRSTGYPATQKAATEIEGWIKANGEKLAAMMKSPQ